MAKKSKLKKQVEKGLKNLHPLTQFVMAIVFVVSVLGTFVVSLVLQKDDTFELIGEDTITLNVGGTYVEPSLEDAIKCVSFGRDITSNVIINEEESTYDPNISPNSAGTYYIVYETTDFKYSGIYRIRTIVVNEVETNEDGIVIEEE